MQRDDRECIVNMLAVSVPLKRYSQGKPQFGSLYIAMELADFGEVDSSSLTVDAAVQTHTVSAFRVSFLLRLQCLASLN